MLSLTVVVDRLACEVPQNVLVKTPSDSDLAKTTTWHSFTWLQLSRAVNILAVWIEEVFALGSVDEVVGYTGINDIRYP